MISLIPILFFAGLGIACLLWLPRGRRRAGLEPRCAACDYIVHGLPGPICPECGSDLSKPGAIVTGGRLPPGRVVRSVGWTLFCLLAVFIPLGSLWYGFVMPRMPEVRNSDSAITLSSPSSKGYQSIEIHAVAHGNAYQNDPDPPPGDLQIKITDASGMLHELVVDPETLHFRDASSPAGTLSTTPLDVDALVAWLHRARVSGNEDQMRREMEVVMTQARQEASRPSIHRVQSMGGFAGMGSSSSSSRVPLPWARSAPMFAVALIWCVGIIRILMTPRKPS